MPTVPRAAARAIFRMEGLPLCCKLHVALRQRVTLSIGLTGYESRFLESSWLLFFTSVSPSPTALADTARALPAPPDAAFPFRLEKAPVAQNGLPWGREAVPIAYCECRFGIRLVAQGHANLHSLAHHHSNRMRARPGIIQVRPQVSGSTSAPDRVWQNIGAPVRGRCAMQKLDSSLALGRAPYERWLGTEPAAIAAAAEALRRFEPKHPLLTGT